MSAWRWAQRLDRRSALRMGLAAGSLLRQRAAICVFEYRTERRKGYMAEASMVSAHNLMIIQNCGDAEILRGSNASKTSHLRPETWTLKLCSRGGRLRNRPGPKHFSGDVDTLRYHGFDNLHGVAGSVLPSAASSTSYDNSWTVCLDQ